MKLFHAVSWVGLSLCSTSVSAATFAGRGIHYVESDVDCPLAGAGTRGAKDCVRIALLDDHSRVEIDAVGKKITIINDHDYKKATPVADVILPARLDSKSIGPFGGVYHVKVAKKHQAFDTDRHGHMSSLRDFSGDPVVAGYEVILKGKDGASTVADAAQAKADLKAKAESANFVQLKAYPTDAKAGAGDVLTLIDSRVGLGLASLNKGVVRLRFTAKKTEPRPANVADLLKASDWQLSVESLTSLIPQQDLKEDLFLYGLDGYEKLAKVMKGLKKGQTVTLTAQGDEGTLSFDGQVVKVKGIAEVVRRYMEFNSLGIALRADLQAALKKL